MTRWKVAQHVQYRFWLAYPASYDSEQPESNMDDDLPRQPLARGFRKWQDALDYADRMARTVEVTLPRITESKAMIPGAFGLSLEAGRTWDGKRNTWVKDGAGMVYVASYDLRPLALALLALAEQEEHA